MRHITRNKHICYILMILGGAAIFFASTMAAGGALILTFLFVGIAGAVLLLVGAIWLRAIEQWQLREEKIAARRRSFRLRKAQEERYERSV